MSKFLGEWEPAAYMAIEEATWGAQLRAQGGLFPGNAHSALRMMEKISSCFSSSSRSAPSFMNGTTVHP